MDPVIITAGIAYPEFMNELRVLIRAELQQVQAMPSPQLETGGLELAQEITRLSKSRLYALVSARQIPHCKRGNRLYFKRSKLQEWVAAGQR